MPDFLNWSDYMGLNSEAAEAMGQRTMVQGTKLRGDADAAISQRYKLSRAAGEGSEADGVAYDASAEKVRTGLASYGEFMKGMSDPAARQALMEKTYGKGAVSWLDSAMAGGGRGADGMRDARQFETYAGDMNDRGEDRRTEYLGKATAQRAADAEDVRVRQAAYDAREKNRLGEEYAQQLFAGSTSNDPSAQQGGYSMTAAQRWAMLSRAAKQRGAMGANGQVDWDKFHGGVEKQALDQYDNRDRTWDMFDTFNGKAKDPRQNDTWSAYYARHKGTK